MRKTGNKGFTLIELLVVIAIIGILSSVVLASLNTARQKSRDAKRVSDMKQLQIALEFSFDQYAQYPDNTVAGVAEKIGIGAGEALGSLVDDNYIPVLPTDPQASNTQYFYRSATGVSYCIGAKLEGSTLQFDSCKAADTLPGDQDYKVGP